MSRLLAASFRQQNDWRIAKRMTVALHVTEDLRAALPPWVVKAMINRLLITALASFAFTVSGHAENIVCPPQNEIADGFGKWTGDYSGSLDEVSLSRQFLGEQEEGAIIRCKREIGSMQIMFQKKSCRLIPEGGAAQSTSYGKQSEETICRLRRDSSSGGTNDKTCIIVCK
jgi:hypothetical protein